MMKYTQEQLEAMSDFEISSLIAVKAGVVDKIKPEWHDTRYYSVCDGGLKVTASGWPRRIFPNYCNSWADMGPIIEREGISLNRASIDSKEYVAYIFWSKLEQADEKPLRAAAIIYLLMH
jgi:hypothetical protein